MPCYTQWSGVASWPEQNYQVLETPSVVRYMDCCCSLCCCIQCEVGFPRAWAQWLTPYCSQRRPPSWMRTAPRCWPACSARAARPRCCSRCWPCCAISQPPPAALGCSQSRAVARPPPSCAWPARPRSAPLQRQAVPRLAPTRPRSRRPRSRCSTISPAALRCAACCSTALWLECMCRPAFRPLLLSAPYLRDVDRLHGCSSVPMSHVHGRLHVDVAWLKLIKWCRRIIILSPALLFMGPVSTKMNVVNPAVQL